MAKIKQNTGDELMKKPKQKEISKEQWWLWLKLQREAGKKQWIQFKGKRKVY